ncbi:MAG: hypothetical protein AB8G11_05590 [Saprospiraceae bacterium]
MAKKKFGLSSTLNKNSKTEEPSLPKKRPLGRSKKNIEEVKEKVEAIHEKPLGRVEEPVVEMTVKVKDENMMEMVKKVQPYAEDNVVVIEEKKTKRKYTKKNPTPPKQERMVRITVDTPKSMHIKLKIKAIENDITIRDYVIGLIKDDLGLK